MNQPNTPTPQRPDSRPPWLWIGIAVGIIIVLMLVLFRRGDRLLTEGAPPERLAQVAPGDSSSETDTQLSRRAAKGKGTLSAEEIVASKVRQFGRSRRDIVHALARRSGKEVPPEVEDFFEAIEAGDWERIDALWKGFARRSGQYEGSTHSPELDEIWPAILDAYGVAQQAHDWPAQKLLDYGHAVLDSLRPGMVYVGGTDPGRWIPTLLSGTDDRIILTQNALADKRYLDYMEFLYADRFATLTQADTDRAFADYVGEFQKRFEHDQQFPDEPKQVRPGETGAIVDGKFQVSGQVSVMAINERLFQMILEKNPGLSFAMEESFPFKSVLADASPLGPIMEVGGSGEQNTLNQERVTQTVDYWRNTTKELLADQDALTSQEVSKSYSKLLSSQAGLFLERNHPAEGEELLRLANQVCPYSPEAVFRYCNFLVTQNRLDDAFPVARNALRAEPNNREFQDLLTELNRKKNN